MIAEKMCPLLCANCRMYPFYYQVTYWPLVDSHAFSAFTDFIRSKNKNVWRLSPPVLWHGLSVCLDQFFISVSPLLNSQWQGCPSPWHCLSAGCGWRTWPPATEGSCKYIE